MVRVPGWQRQGKDGMELIQEITTIYHNYHFNTEVLVASIRSPRQVTHAAIDRETGRSVRLTDQMRQGLDAIR